MSRAAAKNLYFESETLRFAQDDMLMRMDKFLLFFIYGILINLVIFLREVVSDPIHKGGEEHIQQDDETELPGDD